ncbi:MAG TPA: DNA primase [Bacteroidales bacterium]|nr:DNA primase [Bacteroidales bacterium]HPO64705.1 DNA primase [Bacteroidales bacterium]
MIDQSTIDRIYETAHIVEVVGDFVSLKRRGVNYVGLCPFHNEKTPSFSVSPSRGIYKCFGCGKGGNAVNFIMEHEGLSYYEALRYLARKYNIPIVEKEATPEDVALKNERESLLVVTAFAGRFFHETLLSTDEGRTVGLSYFRERGIRDDMIEKFQLGYSPENRHAFTDAALKGGYKAEFLLKTGLSIERDGQYFDRFAGRVMFPIHSLSGQIIAFGGRTLLTDKQVAKYINSPESEIYHKSKMLYGIFQARRAITQHDKCYLVEGYLDVISMHQAGIENVVASSGTSLTADQIRLIKRFTNNVTIVYDGDPAGIKAALRGIDMILEEGLNVRIVLLPEGEDPDSFCRTHSPSEVVDFLASNENDFVLFKARLLLKDAQNDPIKKATLISDIVQSIAVIPDPIVRSVYVRECALLLQTGEQLLYSQIIQFRRKYFEKHLPLQHVGSYQPPEYTKPQASQVAVNQFETNERELVRLLLNYGNHILSQGTHPDTSTQWIVTVAQYIITEVLKDELNFQHPVYKVIFEEYARYYFNDSELALEYFVRHPDPRVTAVVSDLIAKKDVISKKLFARYTDNLIETEEMRLNEIVPSVVMDFKNKKALALLQQMMEQLKEAQQQHDEGKISMLSAHIQHLNQIKRTFAITLGNRTIYP